jgi:hypothetical protein
MFSRVCRRREKSLHFAWRTASPPPHLLARRSQPSVTLAEISDYWNIFLDLFPFHTFFEAAPLGVAAGERLGVRQKF